MNERVAGTVYRSTMVVGATDRDFRHVETRDVQSTAGREFIFGKKVVHLFTFKSFIDVSEKELTAVAVGMVCSRGARRAMVLSSWCAVVLVCEYRHDTDDGDDIF